MVLVYQRLPKDQTLTRHYHLCCDSKGSENIVPRHKQPFFQICKLAVLIYIVETCIVAGNAFLFITLIKYGQPENKRKQALDFKQLTFPT